MVWSTLLSHTLAIMATAESKELGRCWEDNSKFENKTLKNFKFIDMVKQRLIRDFWHVESKTGL